MLCVCSMSYIYKYTSMYILYVHFYRYMPEARFSLTEKGEWSRCKSFFRGLNRHPPIRLVTRWGVMQNAIIRVSHFTIRNYVTNMRIGNSGSGDQRVALLLWSCFQRLLWSFDPSWTWNPMFLCSDVSWTSVSNTFESLHSVRESPQGPVFSQVIGVCLNELGGWARKSHDYILHAFFGSIAHDIDSLRFY